MHSSGYDCPTGVEKSSGVLLLASTRHLKDIAIKEVCPGRLLQTQATLSQTNRPITISNVYQHVWRSHLSTVENHRLRNEVWHTLEQSCHKVPSRHHLLIAGDLNSTIKPQSPHVGSASTPSDATNHSKELQQLIVDLDLCALNTFHSKPKHTYFSPQTSSQIDFVLCRRTEARGQAFHAHPPHSFPIGAYREAGHAPLHVELPLLPFSRLPQRPRARIQTCDLKALQDAVQQNSPSAQVLLDTVQPQLAELREGNLDINQLHDKINGILQQVAREHFPPQSVAADRRVSACPE